MWIVGTIDLENISDIKKRFENLRHKSMLYGYGTDKLNKYKVAVVARWKRLIF